MDIMGKNKINYQGISTLEVLVEAKNYNKWIADEILQHIEGTTLEFGAGTGNLTKFFTNLNSFYITEEDRGLVGLLKDKFSRHKNIVIDQLNIVEPPPKKYLSFFTTIFGINVLEHIKDDITALRHLNQMLNKNGKLLLLVPAKEFAYTKLDKELGHFRRYEKKILSQKLEENGFVVEKMYFFNIVGLLSWTLRDKVKRKNINLKPYHIKIFDSIVPLLRKIESVVSIPAGISIIVIARKK
jgi:SAM-dependent methyltransferase